MSKYERTIDYMEHNSQLVGTVHRELIDKNTGETIEVEQTLKFNYGSKHFWKCYMTDFLKVLSVLEGKHLKVFIYIIRKTKPSNNLFICTYDKMAKDLSCSKRIISDTLKILQKNNFIRKKQKGIWIINPNILVKGNDNKRRQLFSEYNDAQPVKNTKEKGGKDDSGERKQGEEVSEKNSSESSAEDSKESSEENHQDINNTDDSDRDTGIDESHLLEHSRKQSQDGEMSEKAPI